MKERVLSGVQPTNALHIGNYLGAIRNWVKLQDQAECLFCIVDLHALTNAPSPQDLHANIYAVAAAYVACGINPDTNYIFNQSQVSGHAELAWIFNCVTPLGWLNRMTQFKDKAGKHKEQAVLGLYAYPVLQAADILLYKAAKVPVGEDQRQHIELARDIAGAFNRKYQTEYFPMPDLENLGVPMRIMSLRDGTKKMSKSDESDYSRIHLDDDADLIALKIRKAKTDALPIPEDFSELAQRPEAENLVSLYAYFSDVKEQDVCNQFAGANFSVFKTALTEAVVTHMAPIRATYIDLMKDKTHLDQILIRGRDYAASISHKTIKDVYDIVGLLRNS